MDEFLSYMLLWILWFILLKYIPSSLLPSVWLLYFTTRMGKQVDNILRIITSSSIHTSKRSVVTARAKQHDMSGVLTGPQAAGNTRQKKEKFRTSLRTTSCSNSFPAEWHQACNGNITPLGRCLCNINFLDCLHLHSNNKFIILACSGPN